MDVSNIFSSITNPHELVVPEDIQEQPTSNNVMVPKYEDESFVDAMYEQEEEERKMTKESKTKNDSRRIMSFINESFEHQSGKKRNKGKKMGALDSKVTRELLDKKTLKETMKDVGLLLEPSEYLEIKSGNDRMFFESIIYYEKKRQQNLLNFKKQLENQNKQLQRVKDKSEKAWVRMNDKITEYEEKYNMKLTEDQIQDACDVYMQLTYNNELDKVNVKYPFLKL